MVDRIFNIGENGLQTADIRVKSLTNNMVNAETPGFKKSIVVEKAFPIWLQEYQDKVYSKSGAGMIPEVSGVYYDQSSGSVNRTGGSTDFAISGDGYFVVATKWGPGYTRDGRFKLDKDGNLISVAGNHPLMGQNGQITVVPGSKIDVLENGEIKSDGISVNKLRIITCDNPNKLELVSGSIYKLASNDESMIKDVDSPKIVQGYVEGSNISIINEMMELIYLNRAYNVNTKIIQVRDSALTHALEMGKNQ